MTICTAIGETRQWVAEQKKNGHMIGFVPTMGALHEGHLSLVRRSLAENDVTAVSIFVNPLQFGPNEDFAVYPRMPERDFSLLESLGTDMVFHPPAEELIGGDIQTFVDMQGLTDHLCGLRRPGHFRGVCTIVTKLFNILQPDRAYFGRKDLQQLLIIEKMVQDLNFNIQIVPCPIVREADGLAMSSRNLYLSPQERKEAVVLSQAIKKAASLPWENAQASQIIKELRQVIDSAPSARIDYIQIVDRELNDVTIVHSGDILALAVFIGKTRLIDNYIFGEELNF
ncbi:MAG: pantoate--beta-alanine ligase [candidate division KSB1 bacterium]|nr:pantoate--beta-alanine ligase [candidate division KSB1 bacterium]